MDLVADAEVEDEEMPLSILAVVSRRLAEVGFLLIVASNPEMWYVLRWPSG